MKHNDSATHSTRRPQSENGVLLAGLGILAFSFSFPGTVWSLDSFGPWSSAGLRGVLACALAVVALLATRAPLPSRRDVGPLLAVAVGCGLGFPLLTTLALQTAQTAHSAVVIGALPMATAVIASLRTHVIQPPLFWIAAALGAAVVIGFSLLQSHGAPTRADLYLVLALVLCGAGYAEGGALSTRMPGWRVIACGIVFALPVNAVVAALGLAHEPVHLSAKGLAGLAYIAAISQFGGFVVWYRGMALLGVHRASQLQLAQPLLTVRWAVLLLGEHLSLTVPIAAVAVIACIVLTQRAKLGGGSSSTSARDDAPASVH